MTMIILILVLAVTFIDTSGISLDNKLEKLLYVQEDEEVVFADVGETAGETEMIGYEEPPVQEEEAPQIRIPDSQPLGDELIIPEPPARKEAPPVVHEEPDMAAQDDVLAAIDKIYNRK